MLLILISTKHINDHWQIYSISVRWLICGNLHGRKVQVPKSVLSKRHLLTDATFVPSMFRPISGETKAARRVVEAMSWSWSTTMIIPAPWKRDKNSILWEMTYQYFYELTIVHLCALLQIDLSIVRFVTSGVPIEKKRQGSYSRITMDNIQELKFSTIGKLKATNLSYDPFIFQMFYQIIP